MKMLIFICHNQHIKNEFNSKITMNTDTMWCDVTCFMWLKPISSRSIRLLIFIRLWTIKRERKKLQFCCCCSIVLPDCIDLNHSTIRLILINDQCLELSEMNDTENALLWHRFPFSSLSSAVSFVALIMWHVFLLSFCFDSMWFVALKPRTHTHTHPGSILYIENPFINLATIKISQ